MFLEKKKLSLGLGLISWATLVFFTFWNIQKIFSYSCYFMSSWPFCSGIKDGSIIIVQVLILTAVLALLAIFAYYSFKSWLQGRLLFGWLLTVIMLAAAFCLLPFASNDLQFYFSLGKSVASDINPYVQAWNSENKFYFPPSISSVTGVMYGPLAVDLFVGFYKLSAGSEIYFIWLWKIFMLLVLAAVGWLMVKATNISVADKKLFYLFWLTQPFLIFEWVGNGHFDGLWLLLVLLAFIFARQGAWGLVVISLIIGIWIKFIPLLIAPWFLLWWWQETNKTNWLRQSLSVLGGVVVSAVISILFWQPYWQGIKVFEPILLQSKWAVNSLFAAAYYSLKPLAVEMLSGQAHWFLTRFLHLALLIIILYFLWPFLRGVVAIIRRRVSWSIEKYYLATFVSLLVYFLVWQKSFWPWYVIWLIIFGLMNFISTKNVYLKKILIWLIIAPLFFYVPWMILGSKATSVFFYWYVVVLITGYPLWQLRLWRKENYNL